MKRLAAFGLAALSTLACAQQHDQPPSGNMKKVSFLAGHWAGKQIFNNAGPTMIGDATNDIEFAVGGRYLSERLSTSLPGRPASDTRHFLSYDDANKVFKAWWFTDTTVGPMELSADVTGTKVVFTNKPALNAPQLRFTYNVGNKGRQLVYTFEMKQGDNWQLLFTTTYDKVGK